jgi:flagellar basal-body rod modification protein FlgD
MATNLNSPIGASYSLQSIVPQLPASLRPSDTNASAKPEEEFIQLMVAQLQNQDPEKPVDGTALISQLTQMESSFAVQRMSFLSQANQQIATSAAMLGRTVTLKDPLTGAMSQGKVASVDYTGTDPAVSVNGKPYPLTAIQQIQQ